MINLSLLPMFIFVFVIQGLFFSFSYESTHSLYKNISSNRLRKEKAHKAKIVYFIIGVILLIVNLYFFLFVKF